MKQNFEEEMAKGEGYAGKLEERFLAAKQEGFDEAAEGAELKEEGSTKMI
jgi:hypothetical protein